MKPDPRYLYSVTVFSLALCPMAALLGLVAYVMSQTHDEEGDLVASILVVFAFVALGALGHLAVLLASGAPCTRVFKRRRWLLPVLCALSFSALTLGGVVEQTTDVVGWYWGHEYEGTMLIASTLLWSAVATGVIVGVDRVFHRAARRTVA